jgi:site-specific DNA recombinase
MKRAAIYARFSSDLQRDKSIEDQIAFCREAAERAGLSVVATFSDRAISGASTKNRPDFQSMMSAAEKRAFDVLIAEDVDRIARDQGDYHEARKLLEFYGIAIHTIHGAVGRIDGSLRALMSELYLENLADKTRRGLRGVLRDGRHPGGKAFGYRAVAGKRGELEIVREESQIVREIFRRPAAGDTPRKIAADLNSRGVLSPRGGKWNASTINGNHKRQNGMLFTELYVGRMVWNRLRMQKDPATGKRVSRPNASDQRITVEVPRLRIVDDETWLAVREIKAAKGREHPSFSRKPARLLSGLIKCGSCGAPMAISSSGRKGARLVCSGYRERGTCSNSRRVNRGAIEHAVVAGLRDLMDNRVALQAYVRAYVQECRRLARNGDGER